MSVRVWGTTGESRLRARREGGSRRGGGAGPQRGRTPSHGEESEEGPDRPRRYLEPVRACRAGDVSSALALSRCPDLAESLVSSAFTIRHPFSTPNARNKVRGGLEIRRAPHKEEAHHASHSSKLSFLPPLRCSMPPQRSTSCGVYLVQYAAGRVAGSPNHSSDNLES